MYQRPGPHHAVRFSTMQCRAAARTMGVPRFGDAHQITRLTADRSRRHLMRRQTAWRSIGRGRPVQTFPYRLSIQCAVRPDHDECQDEQRENAGAEAVSSPDRRASRRPPAHRARKFRSLTRGIAARPARTPAANDAAVVSCADRATHRACRATCRMVPPRSRIRPLRQAQTCRDGLAPTAPKTDLRKAVCLRFPHPTESWRTSA